MDAIDWPDERDRSELQVISLALSAVQKYSVGRSSYGRRLGCKSRAPYFSI
jgi:hypothetical protein